MKKIIIFIVLLVTSLSYAGTLKAQDSNWWFGGSIGYWHNSVDDTDIKTNAINIIPTIGYEINNQFAVGLKFGYDYNQYKNKVGGVKYENNYHAFVIEPFLRYYYLRSNAFRLFIDLEAGVAMGNNHGFIAGLVPGLEFKPVPRIGIFATCGFLGYKTRVFNNSSASIENVTNFQRTKGWGFSIDNNDVTVGVNYYF